MNTLSRIGMPTSTTTNRSIPLHSLLSVATMTLLWRMFSKVTTNAPTPLTTSNTFVAALPSIGPLRSSPTLLTATSMRTSSILHYSTYPTRPIPNSPAQSCSSLQRTVSIYIRPRICRSLRAADNSAEIQNRYQDRNLMSPYVFAVMYDTRVNLTDALRCGLLSLTEIPAMGSTTFTIFAETMTDRFGYVKPAASSDNQTCESFYTETLSMDPPYTFYTFNMASLPNTDLASCDVSNNSAAFCICQVLIRYGSRVVRGMESARGTTSLDIFIMEGAVVGGIQFFMWFFSLYVL